MQIKAKFYTKTCVFLLTTAITLSNVLPVTGFVHANTDTLAPSSFFNENFYTYSLRKQAFAKDGVWFLKEQSEKPNAIIYEIIRDADNNIIETKEIFNSFSKGHKISYNNKTDKFSFLSKDGNKNLLTPEDQNGKTREFKAYTNNLFPRYDQWNAVLIEKHQIYPSIDVLKKRLVSFLDANPSKTSLIVGDTQISVSKLRKEITSNFESLNAKDICLLYDLFADSSEEAPYSAYKKIKTLENRVERKADTSKQVTLNEQAPYVAEKSEFALWLNALNSADVKNMPNQLATDRQNLAGTYEMNFSPKIQTIDPRTEAYQDFKLNLVKKLSNNISTYGGSMHKQIREKFLSHYNLPGYHALYPNTKRNASEIDSILGISTIQGRGRYSNTMTDNPNSWIESLTYLFKEQNYPWQNKINEDLKNIFPEFSAISVFDIHKNEHEKTICFPFASVAEILAMWAQVTTTDATKLPKYITDAGAWVNHWKRDAERKRLVASHLSYIKQTIRDTGLVRPNDPNLKGKYKSLEDLLEYTTFEDQIYIMKLYIHNHLPKFKDPQALITDINKRIGVPKEDIVLADMVFLDPGLYNDKVGMPQYISPSIIFMLSDPEVFNQSGKNTETNPAHTAASYLKEIGISAKAVNLNHFDQTPFISGKNKANRKMQDIETTIMMLVTVLSLDNVTPEEKMSIIGEFNKICDQAETLYPDTQTLKEKLLSGKCYSFVPKDIIPMFLKLVETEADAKRLLDILNYVLVNGLEQKFTRITSTLKNKNIFLHLFRNGNLKSMLASDISEQFLSVQTGNSKTVIKKDLSVRAKKSRYIKHIDTITGQNIALKHEEKISDITEISENDSRFVKSIKEDLLEVLTILKKQKINTELNSLLSNGDIDIQLFSPTEDILTNYFEEGNNTLYFLSKDKKTIYIDSNFWKYVTKDNLTKTNAIACILSETLAQYELSNKFPAEQLALEAKNAQQKILPGTTIKNITGTFFSRLLASNSPYLKKKQANYSKINEISLTFYQSMRNDIRKNLKAIMFNQQADKDKLIEQVKTLKELVQFFIFNPHNKLTAQHHFLASFFELSSLNNVIKTLETLSPTGPLTSTQEQVLQIFLKEMTSVEQYITHLQKTKEQLLLSYGNEVTIEKAYKHRSDNVYEISINQDELKKPINVEDLIAHLSEINGEKLDFAGFSKGFCTWRNNGWKTYTPNKVILKGTTINPQNLNNILQQVSDLNHDTVSMLLANSDNIYNITPDKNMRSSIYSTNISMCETPEDVVTETFRYILCSPDANLNIHSDLNYILRKTLRLIYIQAKNHDHPNAELLKQTSKDLNAIFKVHKKDPHKSMLENFEKKNFLGKAILNFFRDFKKAELHRHITGSISSNIMLELFWIYPQARKDFLFKFAGFDQKEIDKLSQAKIDDLFVKYTQADALKTPESRKKITSLVVLKNKLLDQSIEAARNKKHQEKQAIDKQIQKLTLQIEQMYGDEKARDVINQFIEYRPTEKIGVNIMEYLDKLEIAKLFLGYEDSLNVMRKYAFISVYEDYIFDNITLTELRTSGVRPGSPYTLQETVKAYVDGLLDAEDLSDGELDTGYILCMFKDLQNEIKKEERAPIQKRLASDEFEALSLNDMYKETMDKAEAEINRDYPDISLSEKQEMMKEELNAFGRMIEDSLLQLSFGRGENFDEIQEKFNFRPKETGAISEKDKQDLKHIVSLFERLPSVNTHSLQNFFKRIEKLDCAPYVIKSIKTKTVLYHAVREEHLNQVKTLLAMKEKWAASSDPLDNRRAEKIVAIDAVWAELDEIVYPSLPAFRYAKRNGLNTTYHIGESWKEGEFKSALKRLKRVMDYKYIDRIGHGTALGVFVNNLGGIYSHQEIMDLKRLQTSLINHPATNKVVLESCPTSNVYLTEDLMGYQQHVSNFFMDRNLNVILAEDNGRVLHTNGLSAEITRIWMTNPAINFAEIINLIGNSFASSFTHSAKDVKTIKDLREKPSSAISLKNITQNISEIQSMTVSDEIILHQSRSLVPALTLNGNRNIKAPQKLHTSHIKGAYYFYDNHTKENLYIITATKAYIYDFDLDIWDVFSNDTKSADGIFVTNQIIDAAA